MPQNAIAVNTSPLRPTGADSLQVASGGTAVKVFAKNTVKNGCYITNPETATANLMVDPVNVPGTTSPGTFGTTTSLDPGETWSFPGPLTTDVWVNSSDSAHAFVAVRF